MKPLLRKTLAWGSLAIIVLLFVWRTMYLPLKGLFTVFDFDFITLVGAIAYCVGVIALLALVVIALCWVIDNL